MSADQDWQETAKQRKTASPPDDSDGAASTDAEDNLNPVEGSEPDVLKLLLQQIHELGEYINYYAMAKADSVNLYLRTIALSIGLAAMGFVACAALIGTASWFLLIGFAEGLGALCGERPWIGNGKTGSSRRNGLERSRARSDGNAMRRIRRLNTLSSFRQSSWLVELGIAKPRVRVLGSS